MSMICFHSHANSKQQSYSEKNKDQTQSDSRFLTTVGLWCCYAPVEEAFIKSLKTNFASCEGPDFACKHSITL